MNIIPHHPHQFGPGTWWILHRQSFRIQSPSQVPQFLDFLHDIVSNIPCMNCRHHALQEVTPGKEKQYLDYYYDGRFVGMFVWMCEFHNKVNQRIGKTVVPWDYAYDVYKQKNNVYSNEYPQSTPTKQKIVSSMNRYHKPRQKHLIKH